MTVLVSADQPVAYVRELRVEEIPNLMHQPYEPVYGARTEQVMDPIVWGVDLAVVMLQTAWKGFAVLYVH